MENLSRHGQKQALFLCLLAGTFDAYTYLCRGRLFCNAQTGNIIRMFMALPQGNSIQILSCLFSLAVFSAGLYCSRYFQKLSRSEVLLFEGSIVVLSAFLPNHPWLNFFCCMSISFCCAVQMCIFSNTEGLIYTSTVCTGNLKKAVLCTHKNQYDQSLFYIRTILCFGAGVCLETLIHESSGTYSILLGLTWIAGALICDSGLLHQKSLPS